jgi:Ca2+-binding EF-hand superfamily protein
MKFRIMIAASLVAAVVAGPALAQASQEERAARFATADANKDGKLSKAEWLSVLPDAVKAQADEIWSTRVDADGDGFITKDQFMALRMGPHPQ